MNKRLIIHPFLFGIYPILFLFSHNIDRVPFSSVLLPLAIVLSFTFLLILLSRWILKNSQKAGLITSLFLILFFFYGHIFKVVSRVAFVPESLHLLLVCGILFIFITYFIIKTPRRLDNFTTILNVIAISLIAISLINIGVYEFRTRSVRETIKDKKIDTVYSENPVLSRDIYYIILDGYANSSVLKKLLNYDNHEFTNYLTEKGFYIASESRSNYPCTLLSLPSSLNMEYLNYLKDTVGEDSKDATILYQMLADNKVMRFLKSKGYTIVAISNSNMWSSPIWKSTDPDDYPDSTFCNKKSFVFMNEFTNMLIPTTILSPFLPYIVTDYHRKAVLCTFLKPAEVQEMEGPKFVFVHILAPHPPYVFGRNGEQVAHIESTELNWKPEWQYLDQLIFVNKKVEELVEKILSEANVSPIIILQADHGSGFFGNSANENVFKERMPIFNAYYLPNEGKQVGLYDSITPVNTFRLIFNYYFNADYDLLEDRVYFTEADKSLYRFIDITNIVK